MHLIMRLSREVNGEHLRRGQLLRDLSRAIYERDPVDMARLKRARNTAGLTTEVLGPDLHRFVKAHIKGGEHTSNRMKAVVASHMKMDKIAKKDIPHDTPLSPADIGYSLITKKFLGVLQNQLVHVRNGCISDDPNNLPYQTVRTVNYKGAGVMLEEKESLCRTSKNECMHSVMSCTFYSYNNMSKLTYNARCSCCYLSNSLRIYVVSS